MAIYHLSLKNHGRKVDRPYPAVGIAMYRAGDIGTCEKSGRRFDYTRKRGVTHAEIMADDGNPKWTEQRSELWNEVEASEKLANSRVAKEIEASLPIELELEDQIRLVQEFVKEQLLPMGVVADVAIHESHLAHGQKNPHTHILLTTRELTEHGFGSKLRELDKKDFLLKLREAWAAKVNEVLDDAGSEERIDHRSHRERGIDKIPQKKIGVAAMNMHRRGVPDIHKVALSKAIRHENEVSEAWEKEEARQKVTEHRRLFETYMAEKNREHGQEIQENPLQGA